jgi:hypothetical protein
MHESAVISNLGRTWIHGRDGGGVSGVAVEIQSRERSPGSGAAGDPTGIDVENLT